ncbi:MAG: hypothetical protein CW716_04920 [Candidatus Bathyarchaeum sp.]|nr:MAG: hypothetical protein CW716_04920 [Candidatus Bathyarchaeum sp.]
MANPITYQHEQYAPENPKKIQGQIIRGLRYFLVLHILKLQPMHGYKIITVIRKNFGIYLGPSSIYPLLRDLERWNYLESEWRTEDFHPKRVFKLTTQGQNLLRFIENSVGHMITGLRINGKTNQD